MAIFEWAANTNLNLTQVTDKAAQRKRFSLCAASTARCGITWF